MIDAPVLVLNQGFEPHDVCRTRRAIVLVFCGKAELVEDSRGMVHSISASFAIPSVIRLTQRVRRPEHERRLTRVEVFTRDRFTCQYCGRVTRDLTLDHVMPRSQGGEHSWENVVSACKLCNRKKGGRTPDEAGMKLMSVPRRPYNYGYHVPYHYFCSHSDWQKYLPQQVLVSSGLRPDEPGPAAAL
ncbi:MAG: HNH endonuclease [Dehalococcoidia bacterium]|jgi:5-methylcytosine-specific restriction endonuclease McrA|nr:HNH endonuclease [Dehalococcoidia bacterium]